MSRVVLAILLFCTLLGFGSRDAMATTWHTTSVTSVHTLVSDQDVANELLSVDETYAFAGDVKLFHPTMPKSGIHHQLPAPHPVELPERSRVTHPSYFLHPDQQPNYLLVYTLADTEICRDVQYRPEKPEIQPWYQCASRPRTGAIDNCQPANLTYRARLTYQLNA
ncbi:hypothetical protein [Pseudoalteromonas xiamenensis]